VIIPKANLDVGIVDIRLVPGVSSTKQLIFGVAQKVVAMEFR